ncbi:MAG TPA: endonuclease III [Candidatus Barnesiella excrementigallinarum]|nr:endonuclease III [Candidatus Barnesiella excrementigallinarum]
MTVKERYAGVIAWFQKNRPVAETELHYKDPFQLLVAVILSAQCTDKRVNMITPALFEAYPTPYAMANATPEEIYEYIKSVSYPNNKAKHLAGMARTLIELFQGEVPSDVDELQKLPGVGRKTANVIASVVFNKEAMAVDTHVFRVSNRIGLTNNSKAPLETEKTLVKNIPGPLLPIAHHWLILHGRYVCMARKPNCMECGIREYCKYYNRSEKTKVGE